MAETDQRDLLPRIAVPTLLIWGEWRLIADFIPAGARKTVLSTTVQASGGAVEAPACLQMRQF